MQIYEKGKVKGWPTNAIKEKERARQDVHVRRHPYEEYFNEMRLCPILDRDRMDTFQVADARMRFAVFHTVVSDQVDQGSAFEI
jgi:hypothetical protein